MGARSAREATKCPGSLDGETFEPIAAVEKVTDSDAISAEKQKVKFVRLDLIASRLRIKVMKSRRLRSLADPVRKPADSADLLVNGSFEEDGDALPAGWHLKEDQPGSAALTAAVDTPNPDGRQPVAGADGSGNRRFCRRGAQHRAGIKVEYHLSTGFPS